MQMGFPFVFFGFSKSMHHSAFHQAFVGSLLATGESGVEAMNSEGWVMRVIVLCRFGEGLIVDQYGRV